MSLQPQLRWGSPRRIFPAEAGVSAVMTPILASQRGRCVCSRADDRPSGGCGGRVGLAGRGNTRQVEVRRYLSRSVTGTWREVHSKRVSAASGSGRPPPHLGGRIPLDAVSKRCMPVPRREAVASSPATERPLSLAVSRELIGFRTAPSPPVDAGRRRDRCRIAYINTRD